MSAGTHTSPLSTLPDLTAMLLQQGLQDQEEQRLFALRQRLEDRSKRFVNAKARTIGVDKDALDKQVEEKRQQQLAEREEKLADAQRIQALVTCLDQKEAAEQEAKKLSLGELKRTLDAQARQPKNNALRMDDPINVDRCGPSSLQRLSGEDRSYEIRKKEQQEQVQFWCAKDTLEKKRALEEERRREQEYAEYVLEQDRIRAELEAAAKKRRDEENRRTQFENVELARRAREMKIQESKAEKLAQAEQSHYLQTCPLLTEDKSLAMNVNAPDHRFRPDHFKGYQQDKVIEMYKENDTVVEEKRDLLIGEAQTEAEWAKRHMEMIQQMAEVEDQKQRRIAEESRRQREILDVQKAELDVRRKELEKARLHEISSEFFSRFGQCR